MTEPANPSPGRKAPTRWERGEDGFTLKERLFVAEVQVDWNYTQAAIRAGYSPKSAGDMGSELMAKPKIINAVANAMEGRVKKAGVNAKWVLNKLVDVHDLTAKSETSTAITNRLRALELIGRHVDVDAFRANGFRPLGEGPPRAWDLTKLDDKELEVFEHLLAKISVDGSPDSGGPTGGTGTAEAGPGTPSDD